MPPMVEQFVQAGVGVSRAKLLLHKLSELFEHFFDGGHDLESLLKSAASRLMIALRGNCSTLGPRAPNRIRSALRQSPRTPTNSPRTPTNSIDASRRQPLSILTS